MSDLFRLSVRGGLAIVAVDTVTSLATLFAGLPYEWTGAPLVVVFGWFGYRASRSAPATPRRAAALVGSAMALGGGTAGWAISMALGATPIPEGLWSARSWIGTAVFVAATGAFTGIVGAVIGRHWMPRIGGPRTG